MAEDRTAAVTIAGIAKSGPLFAPTWPPPVVPVTMVLPMLSESLGLFPVLGRTPTQDVKYVSRGVQLAERHRGSLPLSATFNGLELIWALGLGRAAFTIGGTDNPEEIVPGAYRHTFELDLDFHSHAWAFDEGVEFDGGVAFDQQMVRNSTVAIDKSLEAVWESRGATIQSLGFDDDGGTARINLGILSHSLDRDSATNTDLTSLVCPPWQHLRPEARTIRIGPQSEVTPLDSSHDQRVESWSMTINNALSSGQTQDSGLYIGEPRRRGVPLLSATVNLPRWSSDTLIDFAQAQSDVMASVVYTGDEIAATGENWELGIYFPSVRLVEPKIPTRGAQVYGQSYLLDLSAPDAPMAGMPATALLSPIIVQAVTDSAANPLF